MYRIISLDCFSLCSFFLSFFLSLSLFLSVLPLFSFLLSVPCFLSVCFSIRFLSVVPTVYWGAASFFASTTKPERRDTMMRTFIVVFFVSFSVLGAAFFYKPLSLGVIRRFNDIREQIKIIQRSTEKLSSFTSKRH